VDAQPPNQSLVNTTPQRQSSFNITWSDPDPADDIQLWSFWFSDIDDPDTAIELGITASLTDRSKSISAVNDLNLAEGESGYIFMTAFDQAFVSNNDGGNQSELSDGVMVTNISVAGFCDLSNDCGGCSVSRVNLAGGGGGPGPVAWMLALLFAMACAWRLRR
jgi:hypothetical protein